MRTYEIPDDLTRDDEKWLKKFSNKAIIGVLVAGVVGFVLAKILSFFGLGLLGYLLLFVGVVVTAVMLSVTIPSNRVMTGAGLYLWQYWLRKIRHARRKEVYIRRESAVEGRCVKEMDAARAEVMEERRSKKEGKEK